jgi:Fic family protein
MKHDKIGQEEDKIWQEIEQEQQRYTELNLGELKNYDRYYLYSLITHSTALEGSTLTEHEIRLLFDDGTVANGKNIIEHLIALDLKNAYECIFSEAVDNTCITSDFLKKLNSLVMKSTGYTYKVLAGDFDSRMGDFRLCGVTADFDSKSHADYRQISEYTDRLCNEINKHENLTDLREIYNLSFDAHYNLATIHPWIDGNGRTARLLMNYLQLYYGVVQTRLHKDEKAEYIRALEESREKKSLSPFRLFMANQHLRTLKVEIENNAQNTKRNNEFVLLF